MKANRESHPLRGDLCRPAFFASSFNTLSGLSQGPNDASYLTGVGNQLSISTTDSSTLSGMNAFAEFFNSLLAKCR